MIQRKACRNLIRVVHGYCNKWRLKANVSKSAVMVFSRNIVEGGWEHKLPKVSRYTYLVLILPVMKPGGCT